MPSWNWNEEASSSGVVHESVANTDHNDATILKQGYPIQNPLFSSSLSLFLPLHEDSGSTAYDFSGNNADGTYNGPTLGQTGLLGTTAPSWDNTDDYLNGSMPSISGGLTYAVWINSASTGERDYLFDSTGTNGDEFWIGLDSNDEYFSQYVDDDAGTSNSLDASTTVAQDGAWNLVGTAFDTGNNELRDYVNASLSSSYATGNTSDSLTLDDQYTLGSRVGQPNARYYSGRAAYLMVFDSVFTQSDFQTLYDVVATQGTWTGQQKTL